MNATHISVVIVKLWAVLIVVFATNNLGAYSAYFISAENAFPLQLSVFAFTFIVPCLFAGALWFYPAVVIGDSPYEDLANGVETISANQLMSVGLTVVGIYVLTSGITDLSYNEALRISQNAYAASVGMDRPEIVPGLFASRVTGLSQVAIGVALIFGRRRFSHLLMKLKYGGVDAS